MTNVTNLDDHRKGWVCLHRRIMDNPLFRDNPDARHLFTDLLVLAAWADTEQDWRGKPVTIARGQVMISTRRLAKLVGISHQSARTIIAHMVQHNIVKINTPNSTHPSVITICNFGKYQDKQHNEDTTTNTAPTQRQHSANTQKNKETNKQDNNTLYTPSTITPREGMAERLEDKNFQECKKAFNGNTDAMLETVMAAMQPYGEPALAARWLSTVMRANGSEAVAQAFVMLETKRASNEPVPLPLPWLSKTAGTLKAKLAKPEKPKPIDTPRKSDIEHEREIDARVADVMKTALKGYI